MRILSVLQKAILIACIALGMALSHHATAYSTESLAGIWLVRQLPYETPDGKQYPAEERAFFFFDTDGGKATLVRIPGRSFFVPDGVHSLNFTENLNPPTFLGATPPQPIIDQIVARNLKRRFTGQVSADGTRLSGNKEDFWFTWRGDELKSVETYSVPIEAERLQYELQFVTADREGAREGASVRHGDSVRLEARFAREFPHPSGYWSSQLWLDGERYGQIKLMRDGGTNPPVYRSDLVRIRKPEEKPVDLSKYHYAEDFYLPAGDSFTVRLGNKTATLRVSPDDHSIIAGTWGPADGDIGPVFSLKPVATGDRVIGRFVNSGDTFYGTFRGDLLQFKTYRDVKQSVIKHWNWSQAGDAFVAEHESSEKPGHVPHQWELRYDAAADELVGRQQNLQVATRDGEVREIGLIWQDIRLVRRGSADAEIAALEARLEEYAGREIELEHDPESGHWNAVQRYPDGTEVRTKLQRLVTDVGAEILMETGPDGHVRETITWPDGSVTTTRIDPDAATATVSAFSADARMDIIEQAADGGFVHSTIQPGGAIVTERRDEEGTLIEAVTQQPDGWVESVDRRGAISAYQASEEGMTVIETDGDGNVVIAEFDAAGNLLDREASLLHPTEPGRRYYEAVVGGTQWDALSDAEKSRYASRERDEVFVLEERARKQAQALADQRVDLERRAESQAGWEEAETELERIAAEEAKAKRQADLWRASLQREEELDAARERAIELVTQYEAAVARGDEEEAERILNQQAAHEDYSKWLYRPTPEESRQMDQAMRERFDAIESVKDELDPARIRALAEIELEDDLWWQDHKEAVVGTTRYLFAGSDAQAITAPTTRDAMHQRMRAVVTRREIDRLLEAPDVTPAQRDYLQDRRRLVESDIAAAEEILAHNGKLTAAGYGLDVASFGTAGLAAGAVRTAGRKLTGETAGGWFAEQATRRVFYRGAGELTTAATQTAVGKTLGAEAAEKVTKTLSTDVSPVFRATGDALGSATRVVAGDQAVDAAKTVMSKTAQIATTDVGEAASRMRAKMTGSQSASASRTATAGLDDASRTLRVEPEPNVAAPTTPEELAKLHIPGRNLSREQTARKAQAYIERERAWKALRQAEEAGRPAAEIQARRLRYQQLNEALAQAVPDGRAIAQEIAEQPTVLNPGRRPRTASATETMPAGANEATTVLNRPAGQDVTEVIASESFHVPADDELHQLFASNQPLTRSQLRRKLRLFRERDQAYRFYERALQAADDESAEAALERYRTLSRATERGRELANGSGNALAERSVTGALQRSAGSVPTRPAVPPLSTQEVARATVMLEEAGLSPENAWFNAGFIGQRADGAAARSAEDVVHRKLFEREASPKAMRSVTGASDEAIRSDLNAYMRDVYGISDEAERVQLVDEYFKRFEAGESPTISAAESGADEVETMQWDYDPFGETKFMGEGGETKASWPGRQVRRAQPMQKVAPGTADRRAFWAAAPRELRRTIEGDLYGTLAARAAKGDRRARALQQDLRDGLVDFDFEPGLAESQAFSPASSRPVDVFGSTEAIRQYLVVNPVVTGRDGDFRLRSGHELALILLQQWQQKLQ